MFVLLVTSNGPADDWPQWMGPGRDNVWREADIITKFPAHGPKILWRTKVARGFSGPAVANGKVFLTDYVTNDDVRIGNFDRKAFTGTERILCIDEQSGNVLWKREYPVRYTVSYPSGPRCTPNVDDNRVYFLGAEGKLSCLHVNSGEVIWSQDLTKKYSTKSPLWGYAAHPLIDGDKLITLAGGNNSHVVALNKHTGKEIWRSLSSAEQGYSPPVIIEQAGQRQLILLRPDNVTSVAPDTGREYWSVPYSASNGSIIMAPVVMKNFMYVAGFNNQSLMIEMDPGTPAAKEVWRGRKQVICPVNVQPHLVDDVLYGFDQRGVLRALRLPEGTKLWETNKVNGGRPKDSQTAFIVRHEQQFWLFNELGELIIARMTPTGYTEIDRARVIQPDNFALGRDVVWSMPAFANKHAYVRNDSELICIDLAQ